MISAREWRFLLMNDDLFHINVLNTQISFKSKENREYMEQIINLLQTKTEDTQSKLKIQDPLKCSILTSLFLIDDIISLHRLATA